MRRVKAGANLRDGQILELLVLRAWPAGKVARTLGVTVARAYLAKHRIRS